ncbi:hypothetical protein BCR36DRAFT_301894 [Piromyces finnis]|uniref:Uncharacterized protein n=1 Tax=Piromyces finnis TaxID=1754191 RepID=A0A1Y1V056_9FUNG|nr:hypothetical protein BCR36DRAFT_301894 [Piromyces finnis]|eukprot:ORX44225.1 hypothetical protein BCR36DRAFT_301894 [Piromyces finnis]
MENPSYKNLNAKIFIKYVKDVIRNSNNYNEIENSLLNVENNVDFINFSLVSFIKGKIDILLQNLSNNDNNVMDFEEIKNLKEYRVEFKHVMNDIENYIYHMIKSRKIQFRNFDNLIYGIYI